MRTDVVVLGAGIVGVSVALHLQKRGRSVVLLDRRPPGQETSYGNAGLIERASIVPYPFPRDIGSVFKYGLNRSNEVRYDISFLPRIAPWLLQYWRHSSKPRLAEATRAMVPLIERCVLEHEALANEAGVAALMRRNGWIMAMRSQKSLDAAAANARALESYGLAYGILDRDALQQQEPHLSDILVGGIHWHDPATVTDPGGLTSGYADLFVRNGGRFVSGDARSLGEDPQGWRVDGEDGPILAREAVVALGPWSDAIYKPLGYAIPMAIKRGYHMHYRASGNASLNHPVLDTDAGVLIAPTSKGIRMTTGIEFAPRDAPPSPVQVERCEPYARQIFPLGERAEPEAWMGNRPCLPDMRPVIGPAPRHPGLWFAFGHNHHGLTLGPVTGRLLAEMMTGETPVADTRPFRADRF